MRLLLDEDAKAKALIRLLVATGFDVATTSDLGLDGHPDSVVLHSARDSSRTLLTFNCSDCLSLHEQDPDHPGILAVYRGAETSKQLSYTQIVTAILNLEKSGHRIASNFHVLNAWNY